ncbi:MAG: aminopeptidase P family protein [Clostridia bacterium]|nr:aminopeptidase P family protein [Clostridia bacterium]
MNRARKFYESVGAEAVLTKKSYLRLYLTGFESSAGYVLSDKEKDIFFTDSRYTEAAKKALAGSGIEVIDTADVKVDEYLRQYKQIAMPFELLLYPEYKKFADMGFELVDDSELFTQAMTIKTADETARIQKACDIAEEALKKVQGQLKEGMTETEVAALIEYTMMCGGAREVSFNTIACFGGNASQPHHVPDETKLKFGDPVLIDFGCKFGGYCSDETRTFLFGDDGKHEDFKKAYEKVYEAHMRVLERGRAGMTGRQLDSIARDCLAEADLAKYFTHSLGHGIGINIHEFPRLSQASETPIVDGMVFSDEPGVYVDGEIGIRIEDSCRMENGKIETFMTSDKKLLIL